MTPESRPRRAAGLEKGKYKDHYQRSWVYEQQLWSHRRKLFEKERVYVTMNLLVKHSAGVPRHNHSTYITLPLSSPAKDIRSRVNSVSNRTSLHVKAEKWIFLSCFIWMKTSSCFPVIVSTVLALIVLVGAGKPAHVAPTPLHLSWPEMFLPLIPHDHRDFFSLGITYLIIHMITLSWMGHNPGLFM